MHDSLDRSAGAWPPGESEMAVRIRSHDWAATPLGPVSGWPRALRAAVEHVLAAPLVASVVWGPQRRLIYNDASARYYGDRHPAALGAPLDDVFPEADAAVGRHYDRAYAGEAIVVQAQPVDTSGQGAASLHVFDAYLVPLRDDAGRVAGAHMIGFDVGERMRMEHERAVLARALQDSERRAGFMLRLGDALRGQADPVAIEGDACRMLAEWLDVDRAYYAEIDEAQGTADVARDVSYGGAGSLAGTHRVGDFAWSVAILRTGRCHVIDDTRTSPLVPEAARAASSALGIAACVCTPLIRHGRLVGALCVASATPRRWSEHEVELVREVGERLWAAVERARAEAALRASEARFRAFVTTSEDVVFRMNADWSLMFELVGNGVLADTTAPTADWWDRYIHPEDRAGIQAAIEQAIGTRGLLELEHRVLRADGTPGWVVSRAVPVLDASGAIVEWLGATTDVTGRRAAAAALHAEESRHRALFESIDQGFCTIEMIRDASGAAVDWRYVEVNPAFARQSGFDGEVVGHCISELAPQLDAFWQQTYDQVARTGRSVNFDHEAIALGRTFRVNAFRMPETEPVRVGILFEDISERRRAEAALVASEERLRLALAASGLATWDWNLRDDEVTWSDQHYLMQGYEVGEVTPSFEAWAARVHPDDLPGAIAALDDAREAHEEYVHTMRALLPDGTVRVLAARGRYFFDETGRATRMIGVMEDVTHSRRAQEALRESEARFREFGEASTDILWIREAATLYMVYLSPAFTSIYGMPMTLVYGARGFKRWIERIHRDDRAGVLQAIRRVRAGEDVVHEFRILRPDGELRWIRNTDFPLRDGDGRVAHVGGIAQDVTQERELSGRLGVLVDELQHRTRNLVAVVRSLARRTAAESDTLDGFIACYEDRLSAIARVQGLLSRLGTGEKITFDELLKVELAAHGAHTGQVRTEGPVGVRLRSATVQTFALALHELATNAIKYGALHAPGGQLEVTWRVVREGDGRRLHVDWRERGVSIADPQAAARGSGYGRELIERALPYQLKARTSYRLEPDGVHCTIDVPIAAGPVPG